jgi:hypothetical protein
VAIDDTERAAILPHEARHLLLGGEEAAFERVWREKRQIGWTVGNYGQIRPWANTREWTASSMPATFQCGPDHRSDCVPRRDIFSPEKKAKNDPVRNGQMRK